MNKHLRSLLAFFVTLSLAFGSLALAGCTGGGNEQDNCYGEDMPAVKE